MDEREMGRELLRWDTLGSSPGGDPRELTRRGIRKDRRRMRVLIAFTIFFWVLGAVGIFLVNLAFFLLVAPKLVQIAQDQGVHQLVVAALGKGAALTALCVASLALAALHTIFLVLASRRATLRQVNAQLREITEELKRLQPPPPRPAG